MWSTAPGPSVGRSRNRPSPLIEPPAHGCGYTNFEFVSASDGQCGAICCRKPSYHAGRDQQPAVRLDRDKEPEIMERLHDISPNLTLVLGTFIACAMQTMERLLQDPVDAKAKLRL